MEDLRRHQRSKKSKKTQLWPETNSSNRDRSQRMVLFIIYTTIVYFPPHEYKLPQGKDFCLIYSLMYVHSRHSIIYGELRNK